MEEKAPKHLLEIILIISTLVIASLACSMGGVTIKDGKATLDVTLTEDQLNKQIKSSTFNSDSESELVRSIDHVELNDGFVRIFGTFIDPNGQDVDGSMDVSFSVADDILQVKIIAVDVPGIDLSDKRIQTTNDELQKGLAQSVSDSNGEVRYTEATVTKDGLTLKMEVTASDQK